MLSKNRAKLITSLHDKKGRREHQLFIAEGEKIVAELLRSDIVVQEVYNTEARIENQEPRKQVINITEKELKKISALSTPPQILAVCEIPKYELKIEELKDRLTLVLDDIRDPGNLGTIIRIADWFGIKNIICSEDCVDAYNPKTVQATMGSIARVKIHYAGLEDVLKEMKDIPVYGALLEGENIYKKKLSDKGIIIIGNESKGISEKLLPYITDKISIPSFNEKDAGAESLNAAIATALICSEFRRNI